jgi:hypothetical protein
MSIYRLPTPCIPFSFPGKPILKRLLPPIPLIAMETYILKPIDPPAHDIHGNVLIDL